MPSTAENRLSIISILSFVFKQAALYWFVLSIGIFCLGAFLFQYSSPLLFLHINKHHHPYFDYLFFLLTFLGDGLFNGIVTAYFLIRKQWQRGLFTGLVFALTGGISALLKKKVFADALRPKAFFEQEGIAIRTIDFVKVHSYNSFPSGHTITCVSIGLLLALFIKKPIWQLIIGILTISACFSRIYLAQHFPADVFAGAFIGLGLTVLAYIFLIFIPKKYTTHLLS